MERWSARRLSGGVVWVASFVLLDGVAALAAVPRTCIVIPPGATAHRRVSARLLTEYVKRATGAELPIGAGCQAPLSIHVGRSAYVDGLNLKFEELGVDGFVLKGVDDRNYIIAGPTEDGTEFGVYEFLERYLGVRWLMPGVLWTDVPAHPALRVMPDEVRSRPAFFSRLLSGLPKGEPLEWGRRNRMREGIDFHHNLHRLFPPSRYARSNPEFYPLIKGRRHIPASDDDTLWQPNFSAPGLVEEAVRNIKDHFRRHPEAQTFSLGVNDGSRFDESPESLARENPAPNYLGRRNVSDSYYRWCNEVVEKVLEEYPDKYFGCLAYSQVADPPRFKLNPHIIPFLTYERMRWSDPRLRALGETVTRRWQAVAANLGWYDYAYGQDYCLPRVWPRLMQEYLQFGRDHGVNAHYAELYPNWGEGPKAYVYLRLQWNPDLDVGAALADWYERAVGPEAAPLLKEHFELWERYWTKSVHRTPYWRLDGQYLGDDPLDYMANLDLQMVTRSCALLDQCVQKASTDLRRRRAELLRKSFEFYENSARACAGAALGAKASIPDAGRAASMARELQEGLRANRHRLELARQRSGDPLLNVGKKVLERPAIRGDFWHTSFLWRLLNWASPASDTWSTLASIREAEASPARDNVAAVMAIAGGECPQVVSNPSFETGLDPWRPRLEQMRGGSVERVQDVARTGSWSVVCDSVERAGPSLTLKITPGTYVAVSHVLRSVTSHAAGAAAPAERTPEAAAMLSVQLRAEKKSFWAPFVKLSPPPGEWVSMAFPFEVPAVKDGRRVDAVYVMVMAEHLADGEKFHFDDVHVYRLPQGINPRSVPPY